MLTALDDVIAGAKSAFSVTASQVAASAGALLPQARDVAASYVRGVVNTAVEASGLDVDVYSVANPPPAEKAVKTAGKALSAAAPLLVLGGIALAYFTLKKR